MNDRATPPSSDKPKRGRPALDSAIGDRLRAVCHELIRSRFDGNRTHFAEAIGRSQSAIALFLDGTHELSYDTICRIAKLLDVDVTDLMRPVASGPDSSVVPTPRTAVLSAVREMARLSRFEDAFLSQWIPDNPTERDPHVLWLACKEHYEQWRKKRVRPSELEKRAIVRRYFQRVMAIGTTLTNKLESSDPNDELRAHVKRLYLEEPFSKFPELIVSASESENEARGRAPNASTLALAEACFRLDVLQSARDSFQEAMADLRRSMKPRS